MRFELAPPTAAAAAGRCCLDGDTGSAAVITRRRSKAPRAAVRTHARTRRDLRQDGGNDRPSLFFRKNNYLLKKNKQTRHDFSLESSSHFKRHRCICSKRLKRKIESRDVAVCYLKRLKLNVCIGAVCGLSATFMNASLQNLAGFHCSPLSLRA